MVRDLAQQGDLRTVESMEQVGIVFKKVQRIYNSTPNGWRLATFEEARVGLPTIQKQKLLNKWDRVRLLDGWITGPGYNFEMENSFKGCLGYMLLIKTEASGGAYADVDLSDRGKEVALFLCVDDWNYEVVYWLLNSWSNSQIMNFGDVRGGIIPFSDVSKFKEMNRMMGHVARRLGEEGGKALEKARNTNYSSKDSVKEVLSGMIKIVSEEKDIVQFFGSGIWHFTGYEGDEYSLPLSVETRDVGEAFWNFVCDSFGGYAVEVCACASLINILKMKTKSTAQKDLTAATSILLYLSDFRSDIIHEPLGHHCKNSCAQKILAHAAVADGVPQSFNGMLQRNAMWRCYDETGNYGVLSKLLFIVAKGKYAHIEQGENIDGTVVDILLQCGAQPGGRHAIGKYKNKTVLHSVAKFRDDKVGTEVAQALLSRCDEQRIYEFVNAADERGRTALHIASDKGNKHICGLLVDRGASVKVKDIKGKTALHYALEGVHYALERGIYHVIDVGTEVAQALLSRCDEQSIYEFVNAADERERTALHIASEKGNARICGLLVDRGALVKTQDKKKKTALHYALEGQFVGVIDMLLNSPHVTESLDLKDSKGNIPLDIALHNMDYKSTAKLLSKSKEPEAYFDNLDQEQLLRHSLLLGYVEIVEKLSQKGIRLPAGDCDEDGKTALHLAAMCDNESNAIQIIFNIDGETEENVENPFKNSILRLIEAEENVENMVTKRDRRGRTVLHEAALKGHESLCQILLLLNSELIYMKDKDGRNPLYDAVEGKYEGTALHKQLLRAYLNKDKPKDDLMDRSRLTPLHVAATQGKAQVVEELLSSKKFKREYLSTGDILAQTALHKAVKRGDIHTVGILLKHDAHPLSERDCDGRTALHYAVQAETEHKEQLVHMLFGRCDSVEEQSLLLWASAAGLGTAEDLSKDLSKNLSKDDPLHKFHKFLLDKKKSFKQGNLLKMAASLGDIEMTKELISRGYHTRDIRNRKWKTRNKKNVIKVLKQIDMIKEQGNDKPAISDSLGRLDYAQGLAALFLNPYIKPPIAVGITGSWGMGKSSLMLQTERILLTTAAQMALLQFSKTSSSELPDIKQCKLSKKGKRKLEHIYRQIKLREQVSRNIFVILYGYIRSKLKETNVKTIQEALEKFLNDYDLKNIKVFKALAAMDSSDMLKTKQPKADLSLEENVPAVLTVQYNAWKYRNDTEALAGIAVEITKELEGIMNQAQWLNTCWRNTWKQNKYTLWIEIFFPSLLALVLVSSFTWIAWVVFDSDKLKEWGNAKYAWPPAAGVIVVWTLTKSMMSILKPVSTQLMQYISFPDHTDKLGYQERVISDISFLKDEIGKKASWIFIIFAWLLNTFTVLWGLITESCITSLLINHRSHEMVVGAPKVAPASGSNLRIIVFVDDLDRCEESVILQVLSAVNLVLAVCEISVVIGMDKRLIERAIVNKYENVNANKSVEANQELADMYLQKIIQLPLDLPDPSDEESRRFLRGQLGLLENENVVFTNVPIPDGRHSDHGGGDAEAVQQNTAAQDFTIDIPTPSEKADMGPELRERSLTAEARREAPQTDVDASITEKEKPSSYILIREMLFVRYSKGEENAFLYFQRLATDCRKHPREWKRLLNYHRLVWYIFSVSKETKGLEGWQVQLITWIFVCWEWQDNMNLVIKKWNEIDDLKTNVPSLLKIVEHLMEERERENTKATTYEENGSKVIQKSGGNGEDKKVKITKPEDISKSTDDIQNRENASAGITANAMEKKLDALEKSLAGLKKEMKELKEAVSDELKKDIKEFKEQVSDELKKYIREIKEHMVPKESEKSAEKWKTEKKNWERMKSVLERYDVSMDGIQAFQRFRFYCIAGYLPGRLEGE